MTARSIRGRPAIGSHIVCPQSKAKTIWLLRSVSYSLAKSRAWRADDFQSMRRRSMPGSYSASASKSVPSPRMRRATMPNWASRRKICSAGLRTGAMLGRTRTSASRSRRTCRVARPSGPFQRSQTAPTRPVPRRLGVVLTLALHAPLSRVSGATSLPPVARRGSSASAVTGAARGASMRKSARTVRLSGSPTSASCGTITRKSASARASSASSRTITSKAPPSAGAATHACGAAAATTSASGAANASSTAVRADG